ncbi:semaphorin-1A-like isoform X2 [Glandiceps talaboti]
MARNILSPRTCHLLLFCCILVILHVTWARTFPKDSVPKAKTDIKNSSVYLNVNITLSKRIGDDFYVGSVNKFLIFGLQEDFPLKHSQSWEPNEQYMDFCTDVLKKGNEACQNYISVIEENDVNRKLLVCGTNANRPSCRYYNESSFARYDDVNGVYKAPFAEGQHNQAIFANGSLYAGTVSETMGSKSVISRSSGSELRRDLVTGDSVSRYLNDPDFISTFYIGEKVFFFLRETAMEYNNCGQTRYSRVARVCTNDKGGSNHVLENIWTTFLKARMVCSIPGDFPFHFNEIQDTFKDKSGDVFYGVFTTPDNSIPGSAICKYDLATINRIFDEDGQFKEQETAQHAWLPVSESEVPEPRPGSCVEDSTSLSNNVLLFVKDHTLMHDDVEPKEDQGPLFTITREDYRFTQIVVDKVTAKGGQNYDVMFIGTDVGKILKVVLLKGEDDKISGNLVDEITLGDPEKPEPVVSMELIDKNRNKYIIVSTPTRIIRVNVQYCDKLSQCACMQDPYCGWAAQDGDSGNCEVYDINNVESQQNVQDVKECKEVTPTPTTCECPDPSTEASSQTTLKPSLHVMLLFVIIFIIITEIVPSTSESLNTTVGDLTTVLPATRVTAPKSEDPNSSNVPVQSPKHNDDITHYSVSAHSPTDIHLPTSRKEVTTEKSNVIQPVMPETSKVVGTNDNCQSLTIITICGWGLLAVLGVVLIVYFLRRRTKNSHCYCACFKSRKMEVSTRQPEQGMKSPETPNSITFVVAENNKNNQQEKPPERPPKPSVPPKPTNYNRSSLNSSLPPSQSGRDSIKDINRELKHSFIHSNGGSSLTPQKQMILPIRGEKIAQV